jgi:hypothetical protein
MRRLRFGPVLVAATLASAAFIPILATPAGAGLADGCTIAQWPNIAGGESGLKVACTETTATGSAKGGSAVPAAGQETRLEDFNQAQWHFGAARSGLAGALTAVGGFCITNSATLHFLAASDVNHGISGVGIPPRAFIKAIPGTCGAGNAQLDIAVVAPGVANGESVLVENSDGRSVIDGVTTPGGGNKVCSATADFRAADLGRTISGTYIKDGAVIVAPTPAACPLGSTGATVTVGDVIAPAQVGQTITEGPLTTTTTTRQVNDLSTTIAVKLICSKVAVFGATDVQLPVTGAGIPAGDYITAAPSAGCVAPATGATLNVAATATAAGVVAVIGVPNAASPKNGDVSAILGAEIVLDPSLVGGHPRCDQHQPQGFNLIGSWTNPGSFTNGVFEQSSSAPVNGAVIGEQFFPSSAGINFGGFVINVKATTPGDTDVSAHTDVVFPGLPSGIAVCGAAATTGVDTSGVASTFQYLPTTVGIASAASGTGTPSTGVVRGLLDTGVAQTGKAYMHLAVGVAGLGIAYNSPAFTCVTPVVGAAAMGDTACPANN